MTLIKFQALLLLLLSGYYDSVEGSRPCGTHEPSESEKERAEIDLQEFLKRNGGYEGLSRQNIVVNTYWHVIHDGDDGRLTQAQVDESMSVLNQDFANSGSNFQFNLMGTTYSDNPNWYVDESTSMSRELHQGDCSTLNIYSLWITDHIGHVNYFPSWTRNSCQGSYSDDGVFIKHTTIPGGSEDKFDMGKTLVHETGHWMGLYHTFQGGCFGRGDYVGDTPSQRTPTDGCPSPAPDTCGGGGVDPIENYMDYSDDICYSEFSSGQVNRMLAQWNAYRADGTGGSLVESISEGEICFSPEATAMVKGKGRVSMKDLAVGDDVLTASGEYHTVYTINHFHHTKPTNFLQIRTDLADDGIERALELSAMHLVYIQGKDHPVPAIEVQVGDYLHTLHYGPRRVNEIKLVQRNGLYNPITADGTMLVDGIIASSYTSFTGSAYLEIAGNKLISVHDLLDMTIAPYRAFCMATSSLNICNQHGEDELPTVVQFLSDFYGFFSQQYASVQFLIISIYLTIFGLIQVLMNKYSIFTVAAMVVFSLLIRGSYSKNQHFGPRAVQTRQKVFNGALALLIKEFDKFNFQIIQCDS